MGVEQQVLGNDDHAREVEIVLVGLQKMMLHSCCCLTWAVILTPSQEMAPELKLDDQSGYGKWWALP